VIHSGYLWWQQRLVPDTNILALLPAQGRDPVLQRALPQMVEAAEQRVIVLIGAADWDDARRAAAAYRNPLHPPGQPQKLRMSHLGAIHVPVLCLNGTRDAFCERTLMEDVLSGLGTNWQMHWLEAADHGFHVLKRSGRTDLDVLDEVAGVTGAWLKDLGSHE
jgi:predicted alpha/beta-hydrolase family hydrolase